MKKIYLLFFLLTAGLTIYANPIQTPEIQISELYFDNLNNWQLELEYLFIDEPNGITIDSIFLYSTTDSVKLPSYAFIGSEGIFVITADSLTSDFHIKRFGDTITTISYTWGEPFENMLIFGDAAGASIGYPKPGQSISIYAQRYCKDKVPNIGFINDTIGILGTLHGIVYDMNFEPVRNTTFRLDRSFETSENGSYSARAYARPSTFNSIHRIAGHSVQYIPIFSITYTMEPDSLIAKDIYLLDSITEGVNDINTKNNPVAVYPNPGLKNKALIIDIDLPVISSDIWLEIIDLKGKLLKKKKINKKLSLITAPDKNGAYIFRFLLDSELISSKKVIIK